MGKLIDNVCFCKCHEQGQPKCPNCKSFHHPKAKAPKTHINDKANPDISDQEYRKSPNLLVETE